MITLFQSCIIDSGLYVLIISDIRRSLICFLSISLLTLLMTLLDYIIPLLPILPASLLLLCGPIDFLLSLSSSYWIQIRIYSAAICTFWTFPRTLPIVSIRLSGKSSSLPTAGYYSALRSLTWVFPQKTSPSNVSFWICHQSRDWLVDVLSWYWPINRWPSLDLSSYHLSCPKPSSL